MGHHIVKQPNGKYAVWNTISNSFTVLDATAEEVLECELDYEKARLIEEIKREIIQADRDTDGYYLCLAIKKEIYGE
jgi:hypothetical protein